MLTGGNNDVRNNVNTTDAYGPCTPSIYAIEEFAFFSVTDPRVLT